MISVGEVDEDGNEEIVTPSKGKKKKVASPTKPSGVLPDLVPSLSNETTPFPPLKSPQP